MHILIRHFKTVSFFLGFALDLFFLPKVTSQYYVWVGPIDLGVVFLLILLRQSVRGYIHRRTKAIKKELGVFDDKEQRIKERKHLRLKIFESLNSWTTYFVSFFLGTLLSHILVYYFRSSDVLEVWPIFLIVALAIIANEFLYGIVPDILLFFVGITLYIIFNVPIFLNKVNNNTFLISVLVSVVVISVLTLILQRIYLSKKEFLFLIIFSLLFPFIILRLYYLNYIPAVPLALGDSGFYSYVTKDISNNNISYQKKTEGLIQNKKFFFLEDNTFDFSVIKDSKTLFFFSSIISPADVTAHISHVWEKYDNIKKEWIEISSIGYDVSGGREDGYRGYSSLNNITQGEWRVKVLADQRLVGLKTITVK